MTVYLILLVVLSAWLVALSVCSGHKRKNKTRRFAEKANLITILAGGVLTLGGVIATWLPLFVGSFHEEFIDWAKDSIFAYYDMVVLITLLLAVLCAIGCLSANDYRYYAAKIEITIASLFVLVMNITAFMMENKLYPLHVFLLLTGVGLSALLRLFLLWLDKKPKKSKTV